jgi:large subunit ribosomal protein L23
MKKFITEKSLLENKKKNFYSFLVPLKLNKIQIKNEISRRYNVTIKSINTLIYPRKWKSSFLKKKSIINKFNLKKKALIKLKKNEFIDIYKFK